MDGLPGRAAADGVPHCEGRRLASRGGGGRRGGEDGRRRLGGVVEVGGYRDWRGTAPKVPAGIRREGEGERDRGEGLLVGDRLVDRQTGRNPQTLRLELKRGLGAGFCC